MRQISGVVQTAAESESIIMAYFRSKGVVHLTKATLITAFPFSPLNSPQSLSGSLEFLGQTLHNVGVFAGDILTLACLDVVENAFSASL